MAEKKMTRVEALNVALDVLGIANDTVNDPTYVEARDVLVKMREQLQKPRKKSDAPTKTQIVNRNLAAAAVAAIREHGEPVTSKWICEHVNGIITPQKCTAVMKVAMESGTVVRNKEGKTVTYSVAE